MVFFPCISHEFPIDDFPMTNSSPWRCCRQSMCSTSVEAPGTWWGIPLKWQFYWEKNEQLIGFQWIEGYPGYQIFKPLWSHIVHWYVLKNSIKSDHLINWRIVFECVLCKCPGLLQPIRSMIATRGRTCSCVMYLPIVSHPLYLGCCEQPQKMGTCS